MNLIQRIAGFTLGVALGCVASAAPVVVTYESKEAPKVLCVILGVSNNEGWEIKNAEVAAKKFNDLMRKIFPGPRTEVRLLLNEQVTMGALNEILTVVIPKLPRYSAVIFYFAGHGLHDRSNPNYDEDLSLVYGGAKRADAYRDSLKFGALLETLARAKMTSGLVFLDACYSGALADFEMSHQSILNNFGKRYLLLSSSGSTETTYSGAFTTALIDQWQDLSSHGCVRADVLRGAIQDAINKMPPLAPGVQTVMRLPASARDRCLMNIGKPSTYIVIAAETGVGGQVQIKFDDEISDVFDTVTEPVYTRLAPKRHTSAIISYDGNSFPITLDEAQLKDDLVVIMLKPGGKPPQLMPLADTVNLDDRQLFAVAEQALAQVGPLRSAEAIYREASERAASRIDVKQRDLYATAAAASNPNLNLWKAIYDAEGVKTLFASVSSFSEKNRVATEAENLGFYETGIAIRAMLKPMADTTLQRTFQNFRLATTAKILGRTNAAATEFSDAAKVRHYLGTSAEANLKLIDEVKNSEPTKLAANIKYLPASDDDWTRIAIEHSGIKIRNSIITAPPQAPAAASPVR